jgi:molybdate transport system regulatory protein
MKISPPPTPKRPPMMPAKKPQIANHTNANTSRFPQPDQHVPLNIYRLELRTKVWIEFGGHFVIGEGGADLLSQIDKHRSLTRAAREVGWSYRHAWGYLRRAEQALSCSLAEAIPGKGPRRGMRLSISGRQLLKTLANARQRALAAASLMATRETPESY